MKYLRRISQRIEGFTNACRLAPPLATAMRTSAERVASHMAHESRFRGFMSLDLVVSPDRRVFWAHDLNVRNGKSLHLVDAVAGGGTDIVNFAATRGQCDQRLLAAAMRDFESAVQRDLVLVRDVHDEVGHREPDWGRISRRRSWP